MTHANAIFHAVCIVSAILASGAASKPLPTHESLVDGSYLEHVWPTGDDRAWAQLVDVEGQPFQHALRIVNVKKMKASHDFQVCVPASKGLSEGDVALVRFYARGEDPNQAHGVARLHVYLQKNMPDGSEELSQRLGLVGEWREFSFPMEISGDIEAGSVALVFGTGFDVQAVEIGGVEILRFGDNVKKVDLPRTYRRYRGSPPGAKWRSEALARIEEHRKTDLVVHVVDRKGNPVSLVDVDVTMTRHSFPFSSVVNVNFLSSGNPDVEPYKEKVLELFNASGTENALKQRSWEKGHTDPRVRQDELSVMDWIQDSGFHMRGHVMVWPGWRHLPERLETMKEEPEKLAAAVRAHIEDIALATEYWVDEWDVVNEPRSNHDLMDVCGQDIMVEWFKQARQLLPDLDLYINDYGILTGYGPGYQEHEAYKKTIRFLLDNGAPLTGIGLQGHFLGRLPKPEEILRVLDDFARFGLRMRVTEFDVRNSDDDTQARFTRDFMTVVFSHPGIVGLQFWGFWEGRHWQPDGAMYRRNWEEKANGRVYRELVFGEWWTRDEGTTDVRGEYVTRGFLGDYNVTVTRGGRAATVTTSLRKGAGPLRIVLE